MIISYMGTVFTSFPLCVSLPLTFMSLSLFLKFMASLFNEVVVVGSLLRPVASPVVS